MGQQHFHPTRLLAGALLALALVVSGLHAQKVASSPYAPYEFLVGEWDVGPEGADPGLIVARFRWGPNRSYLQYSARHHRSLLTGRAAAAAR